MSFLENNELGTKANPRYGMSGLGDSRVSLVSLLPQATQDKMAADAAAAQAVADTKTAEENARLVSYSLCDAAARAVAVAKAKATGGCVDVVLCDNSGRPVSASTRQCFDDPVLKAQLINQIKADEIEAGALERMKEMAEAPDSNSEANQLEVENQSGALEAEVAEFKRIADEADAALQAVEAAKQRLANQRDVARSMRSRLPAPRSGTVR